MASEIDWCANMFADFFFVVVVSLTLQVKKKGEKRKKKKKKKELSFSSCAETGNSNEAYQITPMRGEVNSWRLKKSFIRRFHWIEYAKCTIAYRAFSIY